MTGQWQGSAPSCVPRPCQYLDTPPHTVLSFSSESGYDQGYGSTATITCVPGFHSSQPSSLTCGADGQWSGDVHSCSPVTLHDS